MNKLFLMGRLCKDPELSQGRSGKSYCIFRIAVDRNYAKQGEENTDYFGIKAFGKTAEFVAKYFCKGKPILIEGEIQNNNYVDNSGIQKYDTQIVANKVDFVLSDKTGNVAQYPPQEQPQQDYSAYPTYTMPNGQNTSIPPVMGDRDPMDDYEAILSSGNLPF